jgi:hypothetical protein
MPRPAIAKQWVRLLVGLSSLVCGSHAGAFEVQGYSPGMPVPPHVERECVKVKNVDSGVPGYRCNSTLAGEPAVLKIAVFQDKVAGVIFILENGHIGPMLQILKQRYGSPEQPNRHNADYRWSKGSMFLFIKQLHIGGSRGGFRDWGYTVVLADSDLFNQASKANARRP